MRYKLKYHNDGLTKTATLYRSVLRIFWTKVPYLIYRWSNTHIINHTPIIKEELFPAVERFVKEVNQNKPNYTFQSYYIYPILVLDFHSKTFDKVEFYYSYFKNDRLIMPPSKIIAKSYRSSSLKDLYNRIRKHYQEINNM